MPPVEDRQGLLPGVAQAPASPAPAPAPTVVLGRDVERLSDAELETLETEAEKALQAVNHELDDLAGEKEDIESRIADADDRWMHANEGVETVRVERRKRDEVKQTRDQLATPVQNRTNNA